jgi:hypothetical protein
VAYGIGYPFQLAPTRAGMFLNMRGCGIDVQDFEAGIDLVMFDRLDAISEDRTLVITRNEPAVHPRSGKPVINLKQTGTTGFVPFGAKLTGGAAHPHAGTGFGLYTVMQYPADHSAYDYTRIEDPNDFLELHQYTYDGSRFEIAARISLGRDELLDGWSLDGAGVTTAFPDGEDLLVAMSGWRGRFRGNYAPGQETAVSGVARWRRGPMGWRPVSFVAVAAQTGEPSMIQDVDGSLLMCVRRFEGVVRNLEVFRSRDRGQTWSQCLNVSNMRSLGPVGIARTLSGLPYLASNPFHQAPTRTSYRESIAVWPLTADRTGIADNLVVFDAPKLFGPSPNFSPWNVDHPIGNVLCLAGNRLAAVLALRVCETSEVHGTALPTRFTGTYLEEVVCETDDQPRPIWNF